MGRASTGRSALRRARAVPRLVVTGGLAGAAVFGLIALDATPVRAQFAMVGDPPTRFEWRGRVAADFRTEFGTKSDVGDEFDAWRAGIEGDFGGPINESILVGMGVRYAYSSYDFDLDAGSPAAYGTQRLPRDPWNSINTIDFLPNTTVLVGDRFSVRAAVPIRWAGESGADENGFAAGISALVRWQVVDSFSVGLGIGVTSQLEGPAETFPIVALDWRIDENLRLTTEGDWFQGGRAMLLWGPSDAVKLSLSAGYERVRFRLDEYGSAADTDGIGEVTTVPVEAGIRIQLMEEAWLDVRAGLGIAGRLRVESSGGQWLYEQEYDPAPRVRVGLTLPFGLPATAGAPPP